MKKLMFSLVATTMSMGLIFGSAPAKADVSSRNSAYQDIDERVKKMAQSAAWGGQEYRSHNIKDIELKGNLIDGSMVENSQVLTVSSDILENNLGHTVNMPSTGYEHEFEETTSTTNTSGWTFGYNYNASFSVLMVSASQSFSVEYNMSTSDTHETKEKRKFTVPSIEVPVPAGKKYKVEYVFEKVKVSGKNKIDANLYGDVTYYYNNQPMSPQLLYSVQGLAADKQGFEQVIRDSAVGNDRFGIKTTGIGQFSTEFGTRLTRTLTDITDSRNPVKLETKNVPVEFKTLSTDTRVIK
ncbi:ETX/MTX2 family pore-forming toxin [Bacillus wiedmannii]|uniref:ETX/MTX2 family pore-forming toxin n=1 Tax=Bacillus wiedmannii TaxID=1890302 RepID=UPI000C215B60|nr:ETX/MTX2 family pore-forming toxin [Bacillus wiedmannii]